MNNLFIPKHVYANYYNNDLIVLDTKNDKYAILDGKYARAFSGIRELKSVKKYSDIYNMMVENNILSADMSLHHTNTVIKKFDFSFKKGASNIDWRLQYNPFSSKCSPVLFIRSYFMLAKVSFLLKYRKIFGVINLIKKCEKNLFSYNRPTKEEIHKLAFALNKAAVFFPQSVKCLLWAASFTLLAHRNKWRCQFVIGAQNYPFISHAWCEIDGLIIEDVETLKENMAIILKEPFFDER